ncbi:ATP-binding cassette domain-containing protein [Hahella aquimaris]|uniref:ATP-binding cassette domain-containing protein n=1 Tax=Hahella sp. HNIBRBA332 TaxID=3015983 RepID=UPI00273C40A9|nr:ATP-binding cassette domain-containing protein [Hahella sp. HNIBRBA332]WLQ15638.1 ATP-binding cassette domain-containing protein [Hahella sp. HNIBRBA332]
MTSTVISGNNLTFKYSKKSVFNNISFSFESGYVIGLLGENGAGKTTLFDLVSRELVPTSGELTFNVEAEAIAYLPQIVTLPPSLRIKEVLEMISCFQNRDMDQSASDMARLWPDHMQQRYNEIKDHRAGVCSYGEKRWFVTAAMLAICQKSIFILDEPTAGVDVQYRYLIWQLIKEMKRRGCSIIVSSHILDEIGANTDYFYFLQKTGIHKFNGMKDFLERFNASTPDEAFIKATVLEAG